MDDQRFAIVSDLHSNLEAIKAVLKDIKNNGLNKIYCLGDVIGYGPNPNELLSLTEKFEFTVIGNHDEAVLNGSGLERFNDVAVQSTLWTRDEIECPYVSKEISTANKQCLINMKREVQIDKFLFAHGTAISNMEYIMNYNDTLESFQYMEEKNALVCFVGHTHRPGIFIEENFDMIPFDGCDYHVFQKDKRMIINAGSVGQPRDKDWKASYLIVDENRFCCRRVEYDIEKTISKIYGIERLNNYLGDRLRR